jgi:hypothetical protein
MEERGSRRDFLQWGLVLGANALTGWQTHKPQTESSRPSTVTSHGVTFIPSDIRYWGRDPQDVLDQLLSVAGLEVVRVPIYSWVTSGRDGRWYFQSYRRWIERILGSGRQIVPVVGIKQPGYPEVHLPWRIRRATTADKPNVVLDSDPSVRQFTLEALAASLEFLRDYVDGITAIQVENEANFPVALANGRRLSNGFLRQEVAMTRAALQCATMCTYPATPGLNPVDVHRWFDGLDALSSADIAGFNVYPQTFPGSLTVDRAYTLAWVRRVGFPAIRARGRKPAVAEMQVTPWVEGKTKQRPFSLQQSDRDVRAIRLLDPAMLLLWGVDYAAAPGQEVLWRHVTSLLTSYAAHQTISGKGIHWEASGL